MNLFDAALPDRFWSKVSPEPMSGCWLWMGAINKTGYGVFRIRGNAKLAHRVSLGATQWLSSALVVDHLCHNTACVNPSHLRQVTQEINTQANYRSTRTHCARGHEFTPENTYRHAGGRKCRRCHADKQAVLNVRSAASK